MLSLLDHCPVDLRHWDWNFLRQQVGRWSANAYLTAANLEGAELSPDGRLLAVAAGQVNQVRDFPSGQWRLNIPFTVQWHSPFAVAPHGEHLATLAGRKGFLTVWSLRTGERVAEANHGSVAQALAWSADGQAVAGQELGIRSGTLSPALCVGFGAAAALVEARMTRDQGHVGKLAIAAREALGHDWIVNGSLACRYDGNLNIRRDGVDGARLIADLRDIAFSLGSACASGSGRPSHVLKAIGLDYRQARSSIRLGFGRYTPQGELVDACRRIGHPAARQETGEG